MSPSQANSISQSQNNPRKLLSLVYPTFKRPGRVNRILDHYAGIDNSCFEVVLSNNDKNISFEREYKSCDRFLFLDNLVSSRGGDNAINGVRGSRAKYCILMSDEDMVVGVAELCSWLLHETPSLFLLPVITENLIQRPFLETCHFSAVRFDTYISGIGFARDLVSENTCERIVNASNNDYVHLMLAMSILGTHKIVSMPRFSCVIREEIYYEGKSDYFEIRHECFGWEGRSLQRKNLVDFAILSGDDDVLSLAKRFLPEGVFIGCFQNYGVRRTFREAAAIGEFRQALAIFRRYCIKFFIVKVVTRTCKWFKIFSGRLLNLFE